MKQTLSIGALLVVPTVAWLFWMTSAADVAKESEPRALDSRAPPIAPEVQEHEGNAPVELAPETKSRADRAMAKGHDVSAELPDDDLEEETDPVEEARRIRLPVIQAIRGNHPTPEARRQAMLEALRNSGTSDEEWTKQSTAVFDDWIRGIPREVGLRANWSSSQCYRAGCEVELSFPDRASYERASRAFRSFHEEGATHGGRVQTPATEGERGEVRASWIMMRPSGSRT